MPESVPDIVPDAPIESGSMRTGPASRARPKSRIFTTPSLRRMMLSGLISRCKIPAAWAAARALARLLTPVVGVGELCRAGGHQLPECWSLNPLHGEKQPCRRVSGFVHRDDVWIVAAPRLRAPQSGSGRWPADLRQDDGAGSSGRPEFPIDCAPGKPRPFRRQ